MKLLQLLERVSADVWYHGTPELQNLERFENRTIPVSYITDPQRYRDIQQQMDEVQHGSAEYHKLIDDAGKLLTHKTVRSPIFLTNNYGVAKTYADDTRAFDYQAAIPGVVNVRVKPGRILTINAFGQNFRGISVDAVKRGLANVGLDDETIEKTFAHFQHHLRGDGSKFTTDSLAAIVDELGFDIIDVVGIKDNYMGGGPNATVRMVMNPDHIEIIRDK